MMVFWSSVSTNPDVLVVGGGVVGVCVAHFLAERGARVTLLERGQVASGCSYANAGLIVPSHSVPLAAPGVVGKALRWILNPDGPLYVRPRLDPALWGWLIRFGAACGEDRARAAIPLLRDLHRASVGLFERLAGGECGFERKGLLLVYRTEEGFREGLEEAALLAESGLASASLGADEARARVPRLRSGLAGAIHYPEDAHVNPLAFVQRLAAEAERRGVVVKTGVEVRGFEVSEGHIARVLTGAGEFRPDQVVLAAGAESPAVTRDLGLRLPIQPAKGYSVTMRGPEPPLPMPLLLMDSRVAVTPLGPRLRLAGTLELAGHDRSINARRVEAIRRAAREALEGLEALPEAEVWAGLRPCTPDGLPILGRPAVLSNLVVAAGHAMIGLSLGPITGLLTAQIVCGEAPAIEIHALRPDRGWST
jgi:D-amino-acid dehydrogenase